MTQAQSELATPPAAANAASKTFFGHPEGLRVLFTTEAWERFAFQGNLGLITLYTVRHLFTPAKADSVIGYGAIKAGLESIFGALEPQPFASQLVGLYIGLAYFAPILGGLVADHVLGLRRTVIISAVIMAAGHFMMAFESLFFFALLALIIGVGGTKPNLSIQVAALYAGDAPRRDRAYSIFYVGINIGSFVGPLVCGALAESLGWHYGFAAAGVGMLISLGVYLHGLRWLPPDHLGQPAATGPRKLPLNPEERRALRAFLLVCVFSIPFWAAYEQHSNSLMLWVDSFTDRSIDLFFWRGEIPPSWFLSLNAFMVLPLTPIILRLWTWQGRHGIRRTMVTKMAFASWAVAFANLLMAAAAFGISGGGKASPLWLLAYFALITFGELYLAPVGLSVIAAMIPQRLRSMMIGVWFAISSPAAILGGWLSGFWIDMSKVHFFLMIAAIAGLGGALIWPLRPLVWAAWPTETQAATSSGSS